MKYLRSIFAFLGLVLVAEDSLALEPAVGRVGAFDLVPGLELKQYYDDNILSQPSNTEQSWVTRLAPSLMATAEVGNKGLQLNYQHVAGFYAASSADNYNDNLLSAQFVWQPNYRNRLDVMAGFVDGHEDRGTGLSQGTQATLISEPDTYITKDLGISYSYGGQQSKGRLVFEVERTEKEFTSRRDRTRLSDRDENELGVTFYWKVGGRTDALLEARYTDINYTSDPAEQVGAFDTLDSRAQTYLAGLKWQVTGKTEGSIKLGLANKHFDDGDREDFSGASWEVSVQWQPLKHSQFSLSSGREARETDGNGSFIDERTAEISWEHDWREQFKSRFFYEFIDERYQGTSNERSEDVMHYGARFDHALRRWVDLGFSINFEDKRSTLDAFDYQRSQFGLHITMSL